MRSKAWLNVKADEVLEYALDQSCGRLSDLISRKRVRLANEIEVCLSHGLDNGEFTLDERFTICCILIQKFVKNPTFLDTIL